MHDRKEEIAARTSESQEAFFVASVKLLQLFFSVFVADDTHHSLQLLVHTFIVHLLQLFVHFLLEEQ
jgi:hypothetical protein